MKTMPETAASTQAYHDAISERARQLWRERGCPEGSDVELWLEAERELVSAGRIPGAPPSAAKTWSAKRKVATDIDPDAVQEHIATFGAPSRRSATTADVSRPAPDRLPIGGTAR